MSTLVGGADESGRGCVLGPLVVAGVSLPRSQVPKLRRLGVRDSKQLTRARREELYPKILDLASRVKVLRIPSDEIDRVVRTGTRYRKLNYLEAIYFARVIDGLGAGKVVVDAADVVAERFGDNISDHLVRSCRVVAKHKADSSNPVVSAASVVAKVERDRSVAELREEHGDFGSGYPSDPATKRFFSEWLRARRELPDFTRKSWKTWANWVRAPL